MLRAVALSTVVALAPLAVPGALTGCVRTGSSTEGDTLGTKGGRVTLPGGAGIFVQPGALSSDTAVTVAAEAPPLPTPATAVSEVYAFTPHGLKFAVPAKISIPYTSTVPSEQLNVVRLAGPDATSWEIVGGVSYAGGVATFETTTLSYYAIIPSQCTESPVTVTCDACQCCGTCAEGSFCRGASSCATAAQARACDNQSVLVITGELPDLTVSSPGADGPAAQAVADALVSACAAAQPAVTLTSTTLSQATSGVLDPCTDGLLKCGGTTVVLVGGSYAQRLPRELDRDGQSPVVLNGTTYSNAAGKTIGTVTSLTPTHDYFVIALVPDAAHGALILHLWGAGDEGSRAGAWYFQNEILPGFVDGTRTIGATGQTWQTYMLVEWTDVGNESTKDYANDTYTIVAKDVY